MEMDDLMLQKQLASTEIQLQYAQSLPKREVLTTEFTTRPLGLFQGQFGCLLHRLKSLLDTQITLRSTPPAKQAAQINGLTQEPFFNCFHFVTNTSSHSLPPQEPKGRKGSDSLLSPILYLSFCRHGLKPLVDFCLCSFTVRSFQLLLLLIK